MTDIIAKALAHPPVDTTYIAGRWHPARLSLRGIWTEARVLGASLTRPANRDVGKFLILCRARSGSTLLTQLLNAHPDITCDREVLARRVLFPLSYLNRLARKSPARLYGAKLLSYQMVQVQKFRDPQAFLNALHRDGFRFIHVARQSFPQTLSLAMAQSSRVFHRATRPGTGKATWQGQGGAPRGPVEIDVEDFVRRLSWSQLLLDYERQCLDALPHLRLSYETDLEDSAAHQATADRICDWIGARHQPVAGGLRKILPSDPRAIVANYPDLAAAVRRAGLADLLPETA